MSHRRRPVRSRGPCSYSYLITARRRADLEFRPEKISVNRTWALSSPPCFEKKTFRASRHQGSYTMGTYSQSFTVFGKMESKTTFRKLSLAEATSSQILKYATMNRSDSWVLIGMNWILVTMCAWSLKNVIHISRLYFFAFRTSPSAAVWPGDLEVENVGQNTCHDITETDRLRCNVSLRMYPAFFTKSFCRDIIYLLIVLCMLCVSLGICDYFYSCENVVFIDLDCKYLGECPFAISQRCK